MVSDHRMIQLWFLGFGLFSAARIASWNTSFKFSVVSAEHSTKVPIFLLILRPSVYVTYVSLKTLILIFQSTCAFFKYWILT